MSMKTKEKKINLRKYGSIPFSVAVVHGGPGAAGEMQPVAAELAKEWGVLEPLQTAHSLDGQVAELASILKQNFTPVSLIGFSWGAWLSFIVAARYPDLVNKLVLVSSGSFDEKYTQSMRTSRLSRLGAVERAELITLGQMLESTHSDHKQAIFERFGYLVTKADTFDPIARKKQDVNYQFNIFRNVWADAEEFRRRGKLLRLASQIQCPVTAIHGDYDSHSADGVQIPLSKELVNFRFVLLDKCGHTPWIERHARNEFFRVLGEELRST